MKWFKRKPREANGFVIHETPKELPEGLRWVVTVPYRVRDEKGHNVGGGLIDFGVFENGSVRSIQSFDLPGRWDIEFQLPLSLKQLVDAHE